MHSLLLKKYLFLLQMVGSPAVPHQLELRTQISRVVTSTGVYSKYTVTSTLGKVLLKTVCTPPPGPFFYFFLYLLLLT